jgi:hypothetical protein
MTDMSDENCLGSSENCGNCPKIDIPQILA